MRRTLSVARGYLDGLLGGRRARGGCAVYMYHGVVEHRVDPRLERHMTPLEDFRRHVEFLKKRRVIGLADLAATLEAGHHDDRPSAAITFDDGYRNNLLACEVLSGARLPFTIFVSTGAIGATGVLWTAEVALLLLQGAAARLDLLGESFALETRLAREEAYQRIRTALKRLPAAERHHTLGDLRRQFPPGETSRLLDAYPSLQMLTWNQLREVATTGGVGSHGVDHEIHHSEQPPEVRRRELVDSKARIERELDRPCEFFAYPNGDAMDNSPAEVRAAGYRLGFSTRHGSVTAEGQPFRLPRLPPYSSLRRFSNTFFWRG